MYTCAMWFQILCGLVAFKYLRQFLFEEESLPVKSSESDVIFHVANRIEKIYGGKVYAGLRIPDRDIDSRRNIDMILVTKEVGVVVAVRNFSGYVDIDTDGSWVCNDTRTFRAVRSPDPVAELRGQVAVLESYLEQRGLILPAGYLIARVVIPNTACRLANSIKFPEVVISDKLNELVAEPKSGFSNWLKGTFGGGKSVLHDGMYQQLQFILRTAPMWDRLELKGEKIILGEFSDFKGKEADMHALRNVKRSKVSQVIIQRSSLFRGLGRSNIHVLYLARDYRNRGATGSDWKEATVRANTEVLFQPIGSKKAHKIKLSAIASLSFST